jgi:hypothetical protein
MVVIFQKLAEINIKLQRVLDMKINLLKFKFRMLLIMLTAIFSLTACASNPLTVNCPDNTRVRQAFSFDMSESSDIELLDYFYGTPNCPSITNPKQFSDQGKCLQRDNAIGPQRRYEKLYVKWRIKSTGQEYEDTVDLRKRLLQDMTGIRLHFSINGSQLFVYLVAPEPRPSDMPPNGPKMFHGQKTITIYPNEK